MPKFPTFPTLFDEVKTLSTSCLKQWGYLVPGQRFSGIISWSRGEIKTGSIGILVEMREMSGFLELDYKYGEEPVKYRVPIISIPSNLGKGLIWYFRCPHTGKRCRKLYGAGKYFFHREAFQGGMYESQTRSKPNREMWKTLEDAFEPENFRKEKKQLRRYYKGKPTRRYLKYLEMLRKAEKATEILWQKTFK